MSSLQLDGKENSRDKNHVVWFDSVTWDEYENIDTIIIHRIIDDIRASEKSSKYIHMTSCKIYYDWWRILLVVLGFLFWEMIYLFNDRFHAEHEDLILVICKNRNNETSDVVDDQDTDICTFANIFSRQRYRESETRTRTWKSWNIILLSISERVPVALTCRRYRLSLKLQRLYVVSLSKW